MCRLSHFFNFALLEVDDCLVPKGVFRWYSLQMNMNGDRGKLHVSRSKILRSSPSALRMSKGCSPSKLPVCSSSLFSSSKSKAQSVQSGRRGTKSTTSETLVLPASFERKRLFGGKTGTRRSTTLTFPIVVEDGIANDHRDLLEQNNVEEDLETIKGNPFSDEGLYNQLPDSVLQPSCLEKVSKWLEESQDSAMTGLTDDTVSLDDQHEVNGRETCCLATIVPETYDHQERSLLAYILPESIPTAQSPVDIPVDKFNRFKDLSLTRLLIGYFKVMMCLSAVYLGFLLRMKPTSWDNYEPPPT